MAVVYFRESLLLYIAGKDRFLMPILDFTTSHEHKAMEQELIATLPKKKKETNTLKLQSPIEPKQI